MEVKIPQENAWKSSAFHILRDQVRNTEPHISLCIRDQILPIIGSDERVVFQQYHNLDANNVGSLELLMEVIHHPSSVGYICRNQEFVDDGPFPPQKYRHCSKYPS